MESRFLFTDFNAHKVILLELSKIIEDHSALLCHLAVNQASALTQSTLSHSIGDPQLYGSQSTQNASNLIYKSAMSNEVISAFDANMNPYT